MTGKLIKGNKGNLMDKIHLDLTKTFDTVAYDICVR